MRFLADEHFPMASVRLLIAAGHDVVHVGHVASGEDDVDLLVICESEERTMLTFDKDFGDLAFRDDRYPSTGVVLFRLKTRAIEEPARRWSTRSGQVSIKCSCGGCCLRGLGRLKTSLVC
jgi:predicted nuclease of predicted toxin-antitoxin system